MILLGCIALVSGQLCYAGHALTCSDIKVRHAPTCEAVLGKAATHSTYSFVIAEPKP